MGKTLYLSPFQFILFSFTCLKIFINKCVVMLSTGTGVGKKTKNSLNVLDYQPRCIQINKLLL